MAKGQEEIDDAMKSVGDDAKQGVERMKEVAKKRLEQAQNYLQQLEVQKADLDTSAAGSRLDALSESTGFVGGEHLRLDWLISDLGVLRGVSFARATKSNMFEAFDTIAQFNSDLAAKTGEGSNEQLFAEIGVSPDLTSQQISIEQAGWIFFGGLGF